MPTILMMVEHVFVDESAAEDIFAAQAKPVFSWMLTPEMKK